MTTADKTPAEATTSPEKHIYRVRAESMNYCCIYVEAASEDEALDIAYGVDGSFWEEDGGYWEVSHAEESDGTRRDALLPESAYNTL